MAQIADMGRGQRTAEHRRKLKAPRPSTQSHFSARMRTRISLAVGKSGIFSGRFRGHEFVIYRGCNCIHVLWQQRGEWVLASSHLYCWWALDYIEEMARKS